MTYATCCSIKRKTWREYMESKQLSHEEITKDIESHVDKEPGETWTEWGKRMLQGGE